MKTLDNPDLLANQKLFRIASLIATFVIVAAGAKLGVYMASQGKSNSWNLVFMVAVLGLMGATMGLYLAPRILIRLRDAYSATHSAQLLTIATFVSTALFASCIFLFSNTPFAMFSGKLFILSSAIVSVFHYCLAKNFAK